MDNLQNLTYSISDIIYLRNDKLNLAPLQPAPQTEGCYSICVCYNLEMTPCLNFTEVAPDAVFCQWMTFTSVPNNIFIFGAKKCQSGLVCPPSSLCHTVLWTTNSPYWQVGQKTHCLIASKEKLMQEPQIHGLHFGVEFNFFNKDAILN